MGCSLNNVNVPNHEGDRSETPLVSHDHTSTTQIIIHISASVPTSPETIRTLTGIRLNRHAASAAMTHPVANHTAYLKNSTIPAHQG